MAKSFAFYLKCITIGIVTGTANGLFGAGGGMIAVPALTAVLKQEERRAHATAIAVILPLTVLSATFYVSKGFVDWGMTAWVTPGGIIGGFIGAKLLGICPEYILRRIFAVFIIIAAVKILV